MLCTPLRPPRLPHQVIRSRRGFGGGSSNDGAVFDADLSTGLLNGYADIVPLDAATRDALPILLRGACLRFLLTRCYDWINTPANALVTRKDPLAFLRRLEFYSDAAAVENMLRHYT